MTVHGAASATASGRPGPLIAWARQHRGAWRDAALYLGRDALSSLMTMLVLGIALALPAGLYVVFEATAAAVSRLNLEPEATLFLRPEATREQGEALAAGLRRDARVAAATFVDRAAALAEFKASSGLDKVLDALPQNPLPHVVTMRFRTGSRERGDLKALLAGLRGQADVAEAQFDLTWLARLEACSRLLGRGISALAVLLGLGVVLIAGNAIRVAIQRRHEEIEVALLCGATDAYVRRPFLYLGAAFGLGSGCVALLVLALVFAWLDGPLAELAGLYGLTSGFLGIGPATGAGVLGLAFGLGWAGGWLAVGLHLREVEPAGD